MYKLMSARSTEVAGTLPNVAGTLPTVAGTLPNVAGTLRVPSLTTKTLSVLSIGLLFALLAGCETKQPIEPAPTGPQVVDAKHDHPAEGPHHGQLIELGDDEYHAEIVHNDATRTVTVFLLDKQAKNNVPIAEREITINVATEDQPLQFKLPAMPLPDDPKGSSSQFALIDAQLCDALDSEKTRTRINVTIDGKPYIGTVEHRHDHEHGDHGHEKKDALK